MKSITRAPNPVLATPTQTVEKFDKKLEAFVMEMKNTLLATKRPKGVGLAANQIGEPYRIFITKPTAKSDIRVFINPEIIAMLDHPTTKDAEEDEKDNEKLEGCLSIPDIWGHVNRKPGVTIRYQDLQGNPHEETIEGFLATIIQHETDHTNGILFTQRVMEQKNKLYKTAKDSNGKEILEEISIE